MPTPAGLLAANTTLLQPGTIAFRLSDALQMLNPNQGFLAISQQITALQAQIATLQNQIATLQSQMATADSNIATLLGQMATVQGQITVLQAFMNSNNWVQAEVATGLTFLDARAIYTRSFVISSATNAVNNTFTYAHGVPNINYIAQVIAVIGINSGWSAPIFYGNTSVPLSDAIGIWADTTNIYISNGTVIRTNYLVLVKLYYTATDR